MAKGHAGKGNRKKHKTMTASSKCPLDLREAGRAQRRNTANQQRSHARFQAAVAHRAAGGGMGAPKVVSIVAAAGTPSEGAL